MAEVSIEDLRAQAAAAKARRSAAQLTDEQQERAKLLAQIAEDEAQARADEKAARELRGKQLEAEARKEAAGRYLVKFFDLGALLPDADPVTLPGGGVLVVRSPPVSPIDVLGQFYREIEAKEKAHPAIYADLVCESVVRPDVSNEADGLKLRAFLDSSLGHGAAITIGDVAIELGGVRGKQTKRGRA